MSNRQENSKPFPLQRPSSAFPKSSTRPSLLSQISSNPNIVPLASPSTDTNIGFPNEIFPISPSETSPPKLTGKLVKSKQINSALIETMDLALNSFIDKKGTKQGESQINPSVNESLHSEENVEENEIFNREEYNNVKKEVSDLSRELTDREKYIVKQKNLIQKLGHEVRNLRTKVQDPLEVFFEFY